VFAGAPRETRRAARGKDLRFRSRGEALAEQPDGRDKNNGCYQRNGLLSWRISIEQKRRNEEVPGGRGGGEGSVSARFGSFGWGKVVDDSSGDQSCCAAKGGGIGEKGR